MNKKLMLVTMLAVVACVPAHGYKVLIKNATGKPIRVNLGCVAMKGSYHIGMDAEGFGQNAVIETGGYIPQWISAYTYDNSWQSMGNERTVQEDKNIQDVNGCSGDRHITIYGDPDRKITCDKGGLVNGAHGYTNVGSAEYTYPHPSGVNYSGNFYKNVSGNDW